jgi:NO-binding membrane sensor protein with MHYT domain
MSEHSGSIVALSFGLGFVGAYSAINLCDQFRICKREIPKLLSPRTFMVLMAISIGGVSMWAMHFVAMSSVNWYTPTGVRVEIRYRIDYTLISLVAPVILCYFGFFICSKDRAFTEEKKDVLEEFVKNAEHMSIQELKVMKSANYVLYIALFRSLHRIILGGLMTALGVCVMHFVGMFIESLLFVF